MATDDQPKKYGTYEAGCHCGYIKFSYKLSPPLEEGYKVYDCGCSVCKHTGYLLTYPDKGDVTWPGDSRERCASYLFNSKKKDQLFCPKCGSSLGIYFQRAERYGISARAIYGIKLDELTYEKGDGVMDVSPAEDLAGKQWDIDQAAETEAAKADGKTES